MRVEDLDYDLPPDRIAQVPPPRREDARLLVLDRSAGRTDHRRIPDLPSLLGPGDLLVLNDTRVIPARLQARRATGGAVEVLLLEPEGGGAWQALLRAGGRLGPGEVLAVGGEEGLRLLEERGGGVWRVEGAAGDLEGLMRRRGRVPLPPYVAREPSDPRDALDRERYQTLHAREDGAVAAPTAGLHLTPRLLAAVRARGASIAFLTLHVGLGTFEPVRTERLEDHRLHDERYAIPRETAQAVGRTRREGGRVVAVGTTAVRALEASSLGTEDDLPRAGAGRTDLMILPGHSFCAVDALLTNFHLPRSTLLALVCALAGRDRVLAAYGEAVARGYRFYSYGDAMLVA